MFIAMCEILFYRYNERTKQSAENYIKWSRWSIENVTITKMCVLYEYKTHIEFDMDLHLYEMHKKELLKSLPVGRGYNMDSRIEYVLNLIKDNAAIQRQQKSPVVSA